MKKLEELGISPAPWVITKRGEIYSQEGFIFGIKRVEFGVLSVVTTDADARLIVAAPKLYHVAWCLDRLCNEGRVDVKNPFVYEVWRQCRAALAEAAGEEVDDGK